MNGYGRISEPLDSYSSESHCSITLTLHLTNRNIRKACIMLDGEAWDVTSRNLREKMVVSPDSEAIVSVITSDTLQGFHRLVAHIINITWGAAWKHSKSPGSRQCSFSQCCGQRYSQERGSVMSKPGLPASQEQKNMLAVTPSV